MDLISLWQELRWLNPGWIGAWPLSLFVIGLLLRFNLLQAAGSLPEPLYIKQYRHTRLDLIKRIYQSRLPEQAKRAFVGRLLVYGVALLLFHLSLAQPYRLGKQLPDPPAYRDTIFIVDTSISMVLNDYLVAGKRVDRMTMMQSVLNLFINELKGNRIGIIAFSEQAYTLTPLTSDYRLLKQSIRRLRPALLTGRTSHPGRALLYTLKQLQQTTYSDNTRPVLVFISDVNRPDRELDPRQVAAYLNDAGYRLYTIGIGATSYEAAKDRTVRGLIYHPANFAIMEAMAEKANGQFYRAANANDLHQAMQAIQSNEKRQDVAIPRYIKLSLYHWPLLAGMVLLMLMQLLSGRRFRS